MSDWHTFSQTQMAAILGVTLPTIRAAIDDDAPGVHAQGARGTKGKIDATKFVPWWIDRERNRAREKDKGQSQAAVERDLDIEMKREKLFKERRETLPRAVMINTLRDVATRMNVTVTQMPDREADTIIGLRDRESAREALQLIAENLRGELRSPEAWMPPELPQLELSA